jgi:hypothetical protein
VIPGLHTKSPTIEVLIHGRMSCSRKGLMPLDPCVFVSDRDREWRIMMYVVCCEVN